MKFLHCCSSWNVDEFRQWDCFEIQNVRIRHYIELPKVELNDVVFFVWWRRHCYRQARQVLPTVYFEQQMPGSFVDYFEVYVLAESVLQVITIKEEVIFLPEKLQTGVQNLVQLALIIDGSRVICCIHLWTRIIICVRFPCIKPFSWDEMVSIVSSLRYHTALSHHLIDYCLFLVTIWCFVHLTRRNYWLST